MVRDSHVMKTAAVKNLFDSSLAGDTQQRVMQLHQRSQPLWGNLTVARTLALCTTGLEMAMGVINPKSAPFPGNVMGLLIKPLLFGNNKPMHRNSPSSPELLSADRNECDFERERGRLLAAIDRFANQGAASCSQHPHPFFGSLKPQQWAVLMYKHIDHHLRQFGV